MARNVDTSKLENIKTATLLLVVEKGYGGASIAEIAKKAGVAEGYLYRYYKSKSELVNDLLFSTFDELINSLDALINNTTLSVKDVLEKLVRTLFDIATSQPEKMKFLFVLMHDYNFAIIAEQRERIFDLCRKVRVKGIKNNEINKNVDEEAIYLFAVITPIDFINLRFKNYFNKSSLGEREIKKLINHLDNILK